MNEKKISLLVHGPIISKKNDKQFSCLSYLKNLLSFSNNFNYIIISTWRHENTNELEFYIKKKNVYLIKNDIPLKKPFCNSDYNPSKNIYLQAYSVLKGCEYLRKLEKKNTVLGSESSYVIKIRTDQKYPDYLGLINYVKNTIILKNHLCVQAFRPSIPYFFGDTILISRSETMYKLFDYQYSNLQIYDNTHYDMFYCFLKVVTRKRLWSTNLNFPSFIAFKKNKFNYDQLDIIKKLWLNNINLIPKKVIHPLLWRGEIYNPPKNELYLEDLETEYLKKYFSDLNYSTLISNYFNFFNVSYRLRFLHSRQKYYFKIGLLLQRIKKISLNIFYFYLRFRQILKKIFIFFLKPFFK